MMSVLLRHVTLLSICDFFYHTQHVHILHSANSAVAGCPTHAVCQMLELCRFIRLFLLGTIILVCPALVI